MNYDTGHIEQYWSRQCGLRPGAGEGWSSKFKLGRNDLPNRSFVNGLTIVIDIILFTDVSWQRTQESSSNIIVVVWIFGIPIILIFNELVLGQY